MLLNQLVSLSLLASSSAAPFEAAFNNFIAEDPAKCVEVADIKNTQTPVDIAHGLFECIEQKDYYKGTKLLITMLVYNAYDEKRVNPYYANQAHKIIQQLVYLKFTKDEQERFKTVLDEVELQEAELCQQITKLGKPNYTPTYFVFTKDKAQQSIDHALIPDFDTEQVWQKLLDRFDNCSTL